MFFCSCNLTLLTRKSSGSLLFAVFVASPFCAEAFGSKRHYTLIKYVFITVEHIARCLAEHEITGILGEGKGAGCRMIRTIKQNNRRKRFPNHGGAPFLRRK